ATASRLRRLGDLAWGHARGLVSTVHAASVRGRPAVRTVWLSLLLAFAGCSRQHPGDAPHLRAGSDACARCGMVVSDERFAAGYVSDRGESVIFDDLGELLAAL